MAPSIAQPQWSPKPIRIRKLLPNLLFGWGGGGAKLESMESQIC